MSSCLKARFTLLLYCTKGEEKLFGFLPTYMHPRRQRCGGAVALHSKQPKKSSLALFSFLLGQVPWYQPF